VVERAQQAAFAVHFQIACRPDGRRADIAGENGVVVGKMADLLRQILRVNGFVAGFCQIVEPFTRIAIVLQRFIEERRSVFSSSSGSSAASVDLISPTSAISTLLCAPMLPG
jgi:hypothetical protein